jgi:hypothetical protein
MTTLQGLLHSGDGHAARGWRWLGHGGRAVRYTEAWEHETFAEEQARWERSDPEYAHLCEAVRQAKNQGEEASLRADEAKAEWYARVASQRQANDDAKRAAQPNVRGPATRNPVSGPATRNPVSDEPTMLEVE